MNRGANSSPFQRRLPLALMTGDQEQDAVAGRNRTLERPIDLHPGAIEAVAVKVERPVRLDPARAKAPIPAAVERRIAQDFGPFWRQFLRARRRSIGRAVYSRASITIAQNSSAR